MENLWHIYYQFVSPLRASCSNVVTSSWLMLTIAMMAIRVDLTGVTSLVRSYWFGDKAYFAILRLFKSKAISLDKLTKLWIDLVSNKFYPVTIANRKVFIADGTMVAKEGKKMPSVKSLYHSSENSSNAKYIMGHSFQAVSALVYKGNNVFSVPLFSRIVEGVKKTNRDKRTILSKLGDMFIRFIALAHDVEQKYLLVLDAYYGSGALIKALMNNNTATVIRCKSNVSANRAHLQCAEKKPGRPRKYGVGIKVNSLFQDQDSFQEVTYPGNDLDIKIRIKEIVLLWKPYGDFMKFVLIDYPGKKNMVLMCSDLRLSAIDILSAYVYRFNIEHNFKTGKSLIGSYAYHFWMKDMNPIKTGQGDQYIHREDKKYRDSVEEKVKAYNTHVQVGCIAQGSLQYIGMKYPNLVWQSYKSWTRTVPSKKAPTDRIVSHAMRNSLYDFTQYPGNQHIFAKFIGSKVDWKRYDGGRMAA